MAGETRRDSRRRDRHGIPGLRSIQRVQSSQNPVEEPDFHHGISQYQRPGIFPDGQTLLDRHSFENHWGFRIACPSPSSLSIA